MNSCLSVSENFSRRRFLKNASVVLAAGVAFPAIIPARVLGRDGQVAPSNRVALGVVGMQQGWDSFQNCLSFRDVQGVALCDVDSERLAGRLKETHSRANGKGAKPFADFREMIAGAGLDAVILAAPDHWHSIMAVTAARAGLDIYGEKPLAHTLVEGRAIADVVRRHGRVWQTGMWQRSKPDFRRAVQLVRSGRIGKVRRVKVGTLGDFGNPAKPPRYATVVAPKERGSLGKPPPNLNYELWLGPAQWQEYDPRIVHYNWRWVLNFGGGNLLDWVSHHLDIAHWAMDFDATGPVKVTGKADFASTPPWDAPRTYEYVCTYPNGEVITVDSSDGVTFYGENEQWIYVTRGKLRASNPAILQYSPTEEELRGVYVSSNHWRNFIDCVKTRSETITPAETAHRTASVGHLGLVSALTGRTIHWDPVAEIAKDDPGVMQLLTPVFRSPWSL
ncbi:MAG: Gfo/Idh/MocA family oxidoreductase [Puniceicoccales bacterium]|jgi:predicted dehydrogenase|nr:Gfo/Idh/MocA family oxidoreductase [Puniceicoccales bacterium]